MPEKTEARGQWKSNLGFILAASGSAIGLGNIVFFSANAYKFGGGAFYLPYFIALFVIGIPVMILEFGLGHHTGQSYPLALRKTVGRGGEFLGWFAIINAAFISMYYITILSWVLGMLIGSFGTLWQDSIPVPAFGMAEGALPNPYAYFFDMLSSWWVLGLVVLVWLANIFIVRRGAQTIEACVKVFVPLMWLFMLILLVRGLTLENGVQGMLLLFTPNFEVMKNLDVWQGAFSQIFFTLSLGFGIMAAYASYLPKRSDLTNNALMTSFLNCGFEYIAGVAIFTILFATVLIPKASTLSMMFFIIPSGIKEMPGGDPMVLVFGVLFFVLLLAAGLSSSISLVEAFSSALIDKFRANRKVILLVSFVVGTIGSLCFALPQVINESLSDDGTLGLTLLDLVDHWAFSHGLIVVGLIECILLGWVYGVHRIRRTINEHSKFNLPASFDWLVKLVIPLLILFVLVFSIVLQIKDPAGMYGASYSENYSVDWGWVRWLPQIAFFWWIGSAIGGAALLTFLRAKARGAAVENGGKR
ncbi:MAG: sodium-dependent transporter [Candidatus Eisenbacteria bacterium]|nr:sodium-dependent transporter [Candidatus Latescibacterota bacterium]MBD3301644.1 sodium-dependent transporter [Candidatus Eisenbacteria bacterium]